MCVNTLGSEVTFWCFGFCGNAPAYPNHSERHIYFLYPRGNLHSYSSPHLIALNLQGWGLGGRVTL